MPTFDCPICFEDLGSTPIIQNDVSGTVYAENNRISSLPCGHVFHDHCLQRWINQGRSYEFRCPNCQRETFTTQKKTLLYFSQSEPQLNEIVAQQETDWLRNEVNKMKREVLTLSIRLQESENAVREKSNQIGKLEFDNSYLKVKAANVESSYIQERKQREHMAIILQETMETKNSLYQDKLLLEKKLVDNHKSYSENSSSSRKSKKSKHCRERNCYCRSKFGGKTERASPAPPALDKSMDDFLAEHLNLSGINSGNTNTSNTEGVIQWAGGYGSLPDCMSCPNEASRLPQGAPAPLPGSSSSLSSSSASAALTNIYGESRMVFQPWISGISAPGSGSGPGHGNPGHGHERIRERASSCLTYLNPIPQPAWPLITLD